MAFTTYFFLLFFASLAASSSIAVRASINPFSPQAALLRHWRRTFPANGFPIILLSKASPLNTSQAAVFSSYIDAGVLSSHISSFCSAANLFCDGSAGSYAMKTSGVPGDTSFSDYKNRDFKKYQKECVLGGDAFKNYSAGENIGQDSFTRYGQGGSGMREEFAAYAANTNVGGSGFTNYAAESNGETADFRRYGAASNVQGHQFKNYGAGSSASSQAFSSYSEDSNVVKQGFRAYGAEANGQFSQFTVYSQQSNMAKNEFKSYDKASNGALDLFMNYAGATNVARNEFQAYDDAANAGVEQFMSYGGDGANVPENVFRSYGKGTNTPVEVFNNYGNSSGPSTSRFIEYGKAAVGDPRSRFSTYFGNNTSFKDYFRSATTFSDYRNFTAASLAQMPVEPGKFFRRSDIVRGRKIPMPDIRDKMPKRSFLPRAIADRLPFSSGDLPKLVETLSTKQLENSMARTIAECEQPPAKGEKKQCVTSIEQMAEFAGFMVGRKAIVATTASTAGWGSVLVVGENIKGGKETKAVSCHQSMFPYLVYYCHFVPRVSVYDVELKAAAEGEAMNRGVAVCHLDTGAWSAGHEAFLALGHRPGEIEVCHWIYENDFVWVARES